MDRRIFILPLVSALLLLVLLARPDITGLMAAKSAVPGSSNISANITVRVNGDGFIPDGSLVAVHLDDRSSAMDFGEFVRRTGAAYNRTKEEVPQISYDGYGYRGAHAYSLDISEFGIDTLVAHGSHTLKITVSYKDYVFSSTSQTIEA